MVLFESFVQSADAAISHYSGGFQRLVVYEGKCDCNVYYTPQATTVMSIMSAVPNTPLYIYIGKKSGPVYNHIQTDQVKKDVELFKSCVNMHGSRNIQGFVFHALCQDGTIDSQLCTDIVQKAHPLPVTYAKPLEMLNSTYFEKHILEQIITLGFKRITLDMSSVNTDELLNTPMIENLNTAINNRVILVPRLHENNLGMIKLDVFETEEFSFLTGLKNFNLNVALNAIGYMSRLRNRERKSGTANADEVKMTNDAPTTSNSNLDPEPLDRIVATVSRRKGFPKNSEDLFRFLENGLSTIVRVIDADTENEAKNIFRRYVGDYAEMVRNECVNSLNH